MTDPLKVIQKVEQRLARLAALQTLAPAFPPVIVLLAVSFGLGTVEQTWERWGLALPAESVRILQTVSLSAAVLGVVAAAFVAALAFIRNRDAIAAAELIDRKLGCREEIVTLATFTSSKDKRARSPLFPVLWKRAAQRLDQLDPSSICTFQVRQSLRLAFLLTVATAGLIAAAISVLVAANKPPLFAEARQLRRIAREIANSNPGDREAQELAARLRQAATLINNPEVPPQEKIEQLARVEQEVKNQQQRQQQSAAGKGQSTVKGTGKGSKGAGSSRNEANAGKGQEGSGGSDNGNGKETGGSASAKNAKGQGQLAQASADISKVQARLEAEARQKSGRQQQKNGLKGHAPQPGELPQIASLEKPGYTANLGQFKSGNRPGQEQGNRQPGQQHKDYGSSRGDTHLGQFPQPENFEKFYKAGEHGIPMDVKNARYVIFRVPPALISGGGGKTVIDSDRPSARVPYANLPLKEERVAAEPDEQQLIPPRYRDLLR